jgi:NTE family protein
MNKRPDETLANFPTRPSTYDKKVALVLQGGGALGSYQAGVYEALASSPYLPDWVAGISIGAINAAIIAGNAREDRLTQLRAFWNGITAHASYWPFAFDWPVAEWQRQASALAALMFGQPGFFSPRPFYEWLSPVKRISYYDTSALRKTLDRLVDFDRINKAKEVRLSVGAVNVRTGQFAYFDSASMTIRPEHVMASGALPPGFPPIDVDGEHYWDGGLFSNTPLEYVLDYSPRRSRLTFQVDVFQPAGWLPTTLDEAIERDKDIRYASRTQNCTDVARDKHHVRHAINELHKLLPPEIAKTEEAKRLYELGCVTEMDIVQLIYRCPKPEGASKDYEFGRASMERRWRQGLADAQGALRAAPWLAPMPKELGVRVFDLRERFALESDAEQNSCRPSGHGESAAPKTRAQTNLVTPAG